MAQPQLATAKIVQKYTIAGLTHRAVANVRNLQLVGAAYQINSRTTDANDTLWVDAANGYRECLSYWMPLSTTWSDAELWEKVSGAWVLRATYAPISTDHKAGTAQNGVQTTMVLRDTLFYKLKVVLLNGPQVEPTHYTSAASVAPTAANNFAKQWTSAYTVAMAPYIWQVSDSDHYLNTSPFVGFTIAQNRKLRRRQGLV